MASVSPREQRDGRLYEDAPEARGECARQQPAFCLRPRLSSSATRSRSTSRSRRAYAFEALEVSEATLSQRPDDTALKIEAATDAYLLGIVLDQAGRGPEAAARYQRALALLEPLCAQDVTHARIAVVLGEAARHYAADHPVAGDLRVARRQADASVALFESLGASGPLPQPLRWRYASALATRADVDAAEGRTRQACDGDARARDTFAAADRGPCSSVWCRGPSTVSASASGAATHDPPTLDPFAAIRTGVTLSPAGDTSMTNSSPESR